MKVSVGCPARGITATGEVGDADPFKAVADAMTGHLYDEIVVSTLPSAVSRWLRMDLPARIRRRFGLPVIHVRAASTVPS